MIEWWGNHATSPEIGAEIEKRMSPTRSVFDIWNKPSAQMETEILKAAFSKCDNVELCWAGHAFHRENFEVKND